MKVKTVKIKEIYSEPNLSNLEYYICVETTLLGGNVVANVQTVKIPLLIGTKPSNEALTELRDEMTDILSLLGLDTEKAELMEF